MPLLGILGSTIKSIPSSGVLAVTINFLAVAGGGGGGDGNAPGGGGGAGGLAVGSFLSSLFTGSTFNISIGAGGSVDDQDTSGTKGGNTTFGPLTCYGGGYGGSYQTPATSGGSGGGGSGPSNYNGGAGAGTAASSSNSNLTFTGYSNSGSNWVSGYGTWGSGGGGGGAGGAGGGPGNYPNFNGGAGYTSAISGTSVTYAIGGPGMPGYGSSSGGVSNGGTPGSGGSGTGDNPPGNSAGNAGIVIISFSNIYTPKSVTGYSSYVTSGGNKIYTWTSSGSITW